MFGWAAFEFSSLPSHIPKIRGENPKEQHFNIMYEVFVLMPD